MASYGDARLPRSFSQSRSLFSLYCQWLSTETEWLALDSWMQLKYSSTNCKLWSYIFFTKCLHICLYWVYMVNTYHKMTLHSMFLSFRIFTNFSHQVFYIGKTRHSFKPSQKHENVCKHMHDQGCTGKEIRPWTCLLAPAREPVMSHIGPVKT